MHLRAGLSSNNGMSSEESSVVQRPDRRNCVVQRISDGMKECGCRR